MSRLTVIFLSTLVLPISIASAKGKGNSCHDVKSCVNYVAELTGAEYSSYEKLKGEVFRSKNYKITKENADNYLSELLNQNGYTRVKTGKDKYQIISARDIRYNPTKLIDGNTKKAPNNDDYYMMSYQLKNKELSSTEITRSFRPFMSRYGRIIDIKLHNQIIIQDTGRNLNRMQGLLKEIDRKLTKEEKEAIEEQREKHFELQKLQAKNCSSVIDEIKEVKSLLMSSPRGK